MDRPILLASNGGIVTPATPYPGSHYAPSIQEWLPDIAAYVETVTIPSAVVSPTAIFDGRPDDLVRITRTSGAALTFFVDSVAGGNDNSGKGSYDDPWRSLNTASRFLQCAECILNTACQYIQIKVKGTVDYVSGNWNPKSYHSRTLILTGWDGVCDLGSSGVYHAGYINDCRAQGYGYGETVHSGGAVYGGGDSSTAIDCEVPAGFAPYFRTAVNCSGGGMYASFVSGGDYEYASVGMATSVRVSRQVVSNSINSNWGLTVGSSGAAYRASVTVIADGPGGYAAATGIVGRGALVYCDVRVSAKASGTPGANAVARAVSGNPVISGGSFLAVAEASATGGSFASAYAFAGGVSGTVHGAATTLRALPRASVADKSRASRYEDAETCDLGNCCRVNSVWIYSSGAVHSSWASSSGAC